jgi:predicted ATPase
MAEQAETSRSILLIASKKHVGVEGIFYDSRMSSSTQPPFISRLKLTNVLSFKDETIELRALNVIIGPNGSGKSNLISALEVLHAAPTSLATKFGLLGGIAKWIRNGGLTASINASCSVTTKLDDSVLGYHIALQSLENQVHVSTEVLEDPGKGGSPYFWYEKSIPMVLDYVPEGETWVPKPRSIGPVDRAESILSQRRDPEGFPELFRLAVALESIRVYNQWTVGPKNILRDFQSTDLPTTYLAEDGSNTALVVSKIRGSKNRAEFRDAIHEILDGAEVEVDIDQARAQLFLFERGSQKVSARRLSDGTLRFIFLAAILLQENLPRLIVIEEPELGLHPDMLGALAKLLRRASEKTQVIVTTHSTDLVNEFSDEPETILISESHEGSSSMRRLDKEKLGSWLTDYSLGDAWRAGALGGNRWG